MNDASLPNTATIVRLPQSAEAFERLFARGMDLVEDTSLYLDGEGREQAKALPAKASSRYGTQAMALTTRLMRMASWLLIQRSLGEGEIEPDQAEHEMATLKIEQLTGPHGNDNALDGLPDDLCGLIARADDVQQRITRFAPVIDARHTAADGANTQLALLQTAFRH